MSEQAVLQRSGDQAEGLRRLIATTAVPLAVAARDSDILAAYARIKRSVREQGCGHFAVTITHAKSAAQAQAVFANLQRVAHSYLGVRLDYAGMAAAVSRDVSV